MKLITLRLTNFRQHAASVIHFAPGLTGILGTNGAGKSTVLEAIAFALYGPAAARGTKDSITFNRSGPRAKVSVELTFEMAGHTYRVVRGLSSASVFLDGGDTPIASSLSGVTEMLGRVLGMSRQEFFTTYFTGQKELAVMGAMGPADRARFLSRVLGYDRLETAQGLVRDNRRTLVSEATGLRASMPDSVQLEQAVHEADARVRETSTNLATAGHAEEAAIEALAATAPEWERAQSLRAQQVDLIAKHTAITTREELLARDVFRIQRESDEIAAAVSALPGIEADLATWPALREEGARLDREAAADTERQRLLGVLAHVRQQAAGVPHPDEAAEEVAAARELTTAHAGTVAEWKADVEKADRRLREEQALWRDLAATAKAELAAARAAVAPLVKRREALEARGPESPCSTCGVALGDRYENVRAAIVAEIEAATVAGQAMSSRAAALEAEPEGVTAWKAEHERDSARLARETQSQSESLAALHNAERQHAEAVRLVSEGERIDAQLAALPTTYDMARHDVVRAEIARLAPMEARRAVLADKATGAPRVAEAMAHVETQDRAIRAERATVETALLELPLTGEQYEAVRTAHAEAERTSRAAFEAGRVTRDAAARATDAQAHACRRIEETATARAKLGQLESARVVAEELDRTMGDLRESLNFALRPELAEIASGLLETLTDGRYTHAEFSESYELTVLEDGLVKPVISGGEEDLCNLVLRLAISQMIAARAGHAFSLLILDEVFGALDDTRRANVMEMLQRLGDRFAQIIVITHIGQVRDALDHVLRVEYDVATGSSVVVNGDAGEMIEAVAVAEKAA